MPYFFFFLLSVCMHATLVSSKNVFGAGIALIGLTTARSPSLASAWLTFSVGLKSFSHSGFLVNLQAHVTKDAKVKMLVIFLFGFV